jgi:gag-polypeptide of LTR copia-type
MGEFVDSFASILDRLECIGAKIDEDLSVFMLISSMNGHLESAVEAIKTLGDEKLTWDDVCSRLIEISKMSQNKRRDVALTGREMITCDFCDKRGHEAGRCWNPDNPHNRLDPSSDAGPSRINKHRRMQSKSQRHLSRPLDRAKHTKPESVRIAQATTPALRMMIQMRRGFALAPHTPCRRRCPLTQPNRAAA